MPAQAQGLPEWQRQTVVNVISCLAMEYPDALEFCRKFDFDESAVTSAVAAYLEGAPAIAHAATGPHSAARARARDRRQPGARGMADRVQDQEDQGSCCACGWWRRRACSVVCLRACRMPSPMARTAANAASVGAAAAVAGVVSAAVAFVAAFVADARAALLSKRAPLFAALVHSAERVCVLRAGRRRQRRARRTPRLHSCRAAEHAAAVERAVEHAVAARIAGVRVYGCLCIRVCICLPVRLSGCF